LPYRFLQIAVFGEKKKNSREGAGRGDKWITQVVKKKLENTPGKHFL
jgi:hypothetical protein